MLLRKPHRRPYSNFVLHSPMLLPSLLALLSKYRLESFLAFMFPENLDIFFPASTPLLFYLFLTLLFRISREAQPVPVFPRAGDEC